MTMNIVSAASTSLSALIMHASVSLKNDIEGIRAWFFWSLIGSTVVVLIGVFIEGVEHIVSDESKKKAWHKRVESIGWTLVVVGVLGEGVFEGLTTMADDILQDFTSTLLSITTDQASIANARSAKTEKEAAGLKKEAEDEHSARVKIEARVAWRHLSKEQKEKIGTHLDFDAKFGGFPTRLVSVWYESSDIEGSMFAADIAEGLLCAKTLFVQPPSAFTTIGETGHFGQPVTRNETGVVLQGTPDRSSRALVESILEELTALGFDASKNKERSINKGDTPQVWIKVWPRPEGPQGEYKLQAQRDTKRTNRAIHKP